MSTTYTKQDAINLVNAIPEGQFQNCDGIALSYKQSIAKSVLINGAVIVAMAATCVVACVVFDAGFFLWDKSKEFIAKQKAKKEAAIHKTLDEGKPGPSQA